MSGKRTKALRAAFIALYHRSPHKGEGSRVYHKNKDGITIGVPLARDVREVRFAKVKGILRRYLARVLRPIFDMKVAVKSEWRVWKKTGGGVSAFEVRMGWRSWKQIKPADGYVVLPATDLPEAA